MKVREIILRAIAKKITWDQAADVLGTSHLSMDRLRRLYMRRGYDGFWVRARRQRPCPHVAFTTVEKILLLYQEKYSYLDAHSFCQKLAKKHGVCLDEDLVARLLCEAGLLGVKREVTSSKQI
jgi:transposase